MFGERKISEILTRECVKLTSLNVFFQPLSDRHHPFDVRREFVPPDFRGGWSRDMRGREGYDGYDGRGVPGDYERHYERDRPHHDRGIQ